VTPASLPFTTTVFCEPTAASATFGSAIETVVTSAGISSTTDCPTETFTGKAEPAAFALGAATTLLTGRHPLFAGLRQVAFGMVAAAITFGIGTLLGTAIEG